MGVGAGELRDLRTRGSRRMSRTRLIVLMLALLVIVGVGYVAYQQFTQPAAPTVNGTPMPVDRGTLATTVSTMGSVAANQQANLSFTRSGRLTEIKVKVGDSVTAGQVLATLDGSDLELALAQAQSQLRSAQIKYEQMQGGARSEDVQAAQAALQSAQAKLDELTRGPSESDIKGAEQALAAAVAQQTQAESDLAALQAGPDPDAVKLAEQEVERAKSSLWSAQTSRDGTCGNPRTPQFQCDSANASVMAAEVALQQAQTKLEQAKAGPKPEELVNAQKKVESAKLGVASAQAELDRVKGGPSDSDLKAAQSAVVSARAQLAAQTSVDPSDLLLQAEAVKQAEIAVEQAQADLDGATLVAPFAGTVAAVTGNVGELIGANAQLITLVDMKSFRIDATVDETDIAKIKAGQEAVATFDAIPDVTLDGVVGTVSLVGTTNQGVVTYVVSVVVPDAKGLTLPTGLTAGVTITTEKKEGVLLAPNRAIRSVGQNRVVQVMVDGEPQLRPVEVGLANDQFTEIISGLDEGDLVLVPTPSTQPRGLGPGLGAPAASPNRVVIR